MTEAFQNELSVATGKPAARRRWLPRVRRTLQRLAVAALGTAIIYQAAPNLELLPILPGISPFLTVGAALATKTATLATLWCLPVVLISLFRKRWFCRNLCPTGLLTDLAGAAGRRRASVAHWPHFGRWVFLSTLGGAALGYPLFLWLDPLSMFQGFLSAWRAPITLWGAMPASLLIAATALSLWRPHAWCLRVCPLGYTQELLCEAAHRGWRWIARVATPSQSQRLHAIRGYRRAFLGIVGGAAAAYCARRTLGNHPWLIRPPGAAPEDQFAALCVRCGNCLRVCPENLIQPDDGSSGPEGISTPTVHFSPGYCLENCVECTKVCPTGAIAKLLPADKSRVAMGSALINRKTCFAWIGEPCRICVDTCSYEAIREIPKGVTPVPEVDFDKCVGCGLCVLLCPAPPNTIRIGNSTNRRLPEWVYESGRQGRSGAC